MKYIIYNKQRFEIDKLCSKSEYFKGLKDFSSMEIEQDITHRGEPMLIILNFLTNKIIPDIKTPEIAYQLLELNDELLINDDTLIKHVKSLFEKHLNICIDMYYKIGEININRYIEKCNIKKLENLTYKQRRSKEYMKGFYKTEQIMPEFMKLQTSNTKKNLHPGSRDLNNRYEQYFYKKQKELNKCKDKDYFDFNECVNFYSIHLFNNSYYDYTCFLNSYKWINNCYNFEIKINCLNINTINMIKTIFKNVVNLFSISIKYRSSSCVSSENDFKSIYQPQSNDGERYNIEDLYKELNNLISITIYDKKNKSCYRYNSDGMYIGELGFTTKEGYDAFKASPDYEDLKKISITTKTAIYIFNNEYDVYEYKQVYYSERNKESILTINNKTILNSIKDGNIKFLEHAINNFYIDKTNNYYCFTAIKNNQIKLFEWLIKEGFYIDKTNSYHCFSAIKNNQIELFELLKKEGFYIDKKDNYHCFSAIKNNQIKLFEWLKKEGFSTDITNKNIRRRGYILDEKNCHYKEHIYSISNYEETLEIIKMDDLNTIKRLHEYGYIFYDTFCEISFRYKKFDVVKWAFNNNYNKKFRNCCYEFAKIKNFDLLKFAKEKDEIFDINVGLAILNHYLQINTYYNEGTIKEWAKYNSEELINCKVLPDIEKLNIIIDDSNRKTIDIFKWVIKNGCPWSGKNYSFGRQQVYLCNEVVKLNNIELLKWMFENGCEWNNETSIEIIKIKNLDMFKWAHENGCPMNQQTCANIVSNGTFEMLKWAHNNGYKMDEQTSANIASNGNFEMLKWSHENGCPVDEQTCSNIASNGNLEMLKWARENRYPWDGNVLLNSTNRKLFDWALSQGCDRSLYDEEHNCYKCGSCWEDGESCKCKYNSGFSYFDYYEDEDEYFNREHERQTGWYD